MTIRWPLWLAFLLPAGLRADCLSLVPPPAGSACSPKAAEIEFLDQRGAGEAAERRGSTVDRLISDPAFRTGVWVDGPASFRLRTTAARVVEVFLLLPREVPYPVVLDVDGTPADTRYDTRPGPARMRPRSGFEEISLLARVEPGVTIRVRTPAPRYVVSAVRTTPILVFERDLVPGYRRRLRQLIENPFLDGLRSARRYPIEQLASRLLLSDDRETRIEGAVGVARALYWEAAENHEPRDIERAGRALEEAIRLAPEHAVLRQMISAACTGLNTGRREMPSGPTLCGASKPVPWTVPVPADPPSTPKWAATQRRLVHRMNAITQWWVERRQNPDGELGGGWGDDVEILRSWGPLALGFGSRIAVEGIRRLSDGLCASGQLLHGYAREISDVEHSSEPTTDTLPLSAAIDPEDPAGLARLEETAACAFHWIQPQPDGRRRFRSSWFSCREFDRRPERALDVHLNTRAMGPALWHAFFTRKPEMTALLSQWGEAWVEAMRATRHGKPAGIFPPVLRSADGDYRIGAGSWDRPEAEWDYFQWSGGAQESLTSLLLALYDLTGQRRWLDAVEESLAPMEQCAKHPQLCEKMRAAPEAFFEWRRLTANKRFDGAFGFEPHASREAALAHMAEEAQAAAARLAGNFDMFTSEVLFTDRVYYTLPADYRQRLFGGESPRGDRYPTFAVTWPVSGVEFARAVLDASPRSLEFALYSFDDGEREVPALLWRLEKGRYRWESRSQEGRLLTSGAFVVERRPQEVRFKIPGRSPAFVKVRPASEQSPAAATRE